MPLFRRTPPAPPPPSNDEILNTLAAVALMAHEDGVIALSQHDAELLSFAQAEAHRRGLFAKHPPTAFEADAIEQAARTGWWSR